MNKQRFQLPILQLRRQKQRPRLTHSTISFTTRPHTTWLKYSNGQCDTLDTMEHHLELPQMSMVGIRRLRSRRRRRVTRPTRILLSSHLFFYLRTLNSLILYSNSRPPLPLIVKSTACQVGSCCAGGLVLDINIDPITCFRK
jgi:hypothetical protein